MCHVAQCQARVSSGAAALFVSEGRRFCNKLLQVCRLAVTLLCTGVPITQAQSQTPSVAGQPLSEQLQACVACHGEGGNATAPNMPSLAGQQPLFLTNQLILFREGLRKSDLMTPVAQGLKDDEILAISEAFAKMPPKPAAVPVAAAEEPRMKRGAELVSQLRCNNCHLPSLQGREQIPRISAQREDYLAQSMKQYRDNQRVGSDTSMTAAMYGVVEADIEALAYFLARQK